MSLFQNHSDLFCLSFRRKPESSKFKVFWTPVFTGVTVMGPPERVYIVSTLMKRYTRFRIKSGMTKYTKAFQVIRIANVKNFPNDSFNLIS